MKRPWGAGGLKAFQASGSRILIRIGTSFAEQGWVRIPTPPLLPGA